MYSQIVAEMKASFNWEMCPAYDSHDSDATQIELAQVGHTETESNSMNCTVIAHEAKKHITDTIQNDQDQLDELDDGER